MNSATRRIGTAAAIGMLVVACSNGGVTDTGLKEVQRVKAGDLDIVLLSDDGTLNQGKESFVIEFRKADGTLADAGTVTTTANMPMPGMTMPGNIAVEPSGVAGRYQVGGDFGMAGAWPMKIAWSGPIGQGSVSFDGNVQ